MESGLPFGTDEQWTAFTLWVALLIYNAAMILEKNPIFGAVYVVVLIAIMDAQQDFESIVLNAQIILAIHSLSLTGLTRYMVYDTFIESLNEPEFWDRGILY